MIQTPHRKVLLLHLPVIHEGFIRLFSQVSPMVDEVHIFGKSIVSQFPSLGKRIEKLDPELAATLLRALGLFSQVSVIEEDALPSLANAEILMADDHASRMIHARHFSTADVSRLLVFLSWDESNVQTITAAEYGCPISDDPRDTAIMDRLEREAQNSPDPWRRVAAALTRDEEVLQTAYNAPLTSDHTQHALGDVRCFLPAGKLSHLAIPAHAEPKVIGWAAHNGVATKGCDIYTLTFPCPPCGKYIILAGIGKVYFRYGWANLDSLDLFREFDVELIQVE